MVMTIGASGDSDTGAFKFFRRSSVSCPVAVVTVVINVVVDSVVVVGVVVGGVIAVAVVCWRRWRCRMF